VLSDRAYLLGQQYRTDDNLNARARLHWHYSTNSYGWFRWEFERLDIPAEADVLELGCGTATLWTDNVDRIPPGWRLILSDFSAGMLDAAQRNLADVRRAIRYEVIDAQAISLPDASVDAVIANHMLYHVPDRDRALADIRRVLRPGGRLFAGTNGAGHMRELDELLIAVAPDEASVRDESRHTRAFGLETGGGQLAPWFREVTCEDYEDGLAVTEVQPVVDYVLSMSVASAFDDGRVADVRRRVEASIAQRGAFHITKSIGLFRAIR